MAAATDGGGIIVPDGLDCPADGAPVGGDHGGWPGADGAVAASTDGRRIVPYEPSSPLVTEHDRLVMRLDQYMRTYGLTLDETAELIGFGAAVCLSNWLNGQAGAHEALHDDVVRAFLDDSCSEEEGEEDEDELEESPTAPLLALPLSGGKRKRVSDAQADCSQAELEHDALAQQLMLHMLAHGLSRSSTAVQLRFDDRCTMSDWLNGNAGAHEAEYDGMVKKFLAGAREDAQLPESRPAVPDISRARDAIAALFCFA